MKRGPYKKATVRNRSLLAQIRAIKKEHPFWGYRRVCAWLENKHNIRANRKRVYGLMRRHNLIVKRNENLRAKRIPEGTKPKPTRPNEWWGIDMTKVMTGSGWVYVVIVLDWYTKKVVGHYAGQQSKSEHWLLALNMALQRQFPQGCRGQGLMLMSDNGCQPTSKAFMKACQTLDVGQAFTSYNNPKGNADTERFMRTFKEELAWLFDWDNANAFISKTNSWVKGYNHEYPHSVLGYKAPNTFEAEFFSSNQPQIPLSKAA